MLKMEAWLGKYQMAFERPSVTVQSFAGELFESKILGVFSVSTKTSVLLKQNVCSTGTIDAGELGLRNQLRWRREKHQEGEIFEKHFFKRSRGG